jgi:hypothetical protein
LGAIVRIVASIIVGCVVLLGSGCTIWQKETTNRGGYLDYVLDQHWFKADSKRMRALRAFAIEVSLARIASVSAKNQTDRDLLASRIGILTKKFSVALYACAFDYNPLLGAGQTDPCFYYDSAMVEYSTGLFDLAMVALPVEDAKNLVNAVAGAALSPIAFTDLLNALLTVGKDALNYGRVVGALYRDTIELEVQLWLATPGIDTRPPPYRVTAEDVAPLRAIYAQGNDDMPAWIAAIAALRSRGLEPLPNQKFFLELDGLLNYICDLISTSSTSCKVNLPTIPVPPAVAGAVHITVPQPSAPPKIAVATPPAKPPAPPAPNPPANNQNTGAAQLQAQYTAIKAKIDSATGTINALLATGKQSNSDTTRAQAQTQINFQIKTLNDSVAGKVSTLLSDAEKQNLPDITTEAQALQQTLTTLSALTDHAFDAPAKAN